MHSPIKVITVEREYGSRGGEFAHDLAERLGWRLLDAELVSAAGKRAGVAPELAAKFDDRLDPWYYRYGKVFWHDTAYQMTGLSDEHVFDSERMLTLIREEILNAAKQGNCVLVGRGAACASGLSTGMLSYFCVRHVEGETRLVYAGVSQTGAQRGAGVGGIRQAARRGDSQVLSAGVVLARALSHAAEFGDGH